MKITSLYLENFKTIKGFYQVPVEDGINLITATNNGRGKTTIIHAILFLIVGHVSGKTIEDYVNWEIEDDEKMACGIEFEYLSNTFKVDYSYSKGKSEKTLTLNSESFNSTSASNKKLKEYFDPSLFLSATSLLQGEKNFVSVKDSERRDNLKKIFNLDFSQELKDLEKEEKDLQEKELVPKERELAICQSKTFKLKDVSESQTTEVDYKDAKEKLSIVDKELFNVEAEIKSIDTVKKEKTLLDSKLIVETSSLETAQNQLSKLEIEVKLLNEYKKDTTKIDEFNTSLLDIKLERIKAFEETDLLVNNQDISNTKSEIRVLNNKLNDCLSGKCPTCGKDFDSNDISQTRFTLDLLNNSLIELQSKNDMLKLEKSTYENAVRINESKRRDKELIVSKIEAEESRLKIQEETNKKTIESKLSSIEVSKLSIKDKLATVEDIKSKLLLIVIKDISDLNEQLSKLKSEKTQLQTLISNYDKILIENKLIEEQNKQTALLEIENKKALISLQEEIDILIEKKVQLSKMKSFLKKEFPSYVISSMIKQIQFDMNDFIDRVYYKSLDVEINGDDDNISVLYGTGNKKIDCSCASGAEESILALSFTHALNNLKHFDILLIDEVDSFMTEENSLILAETIISIQDDYDFIGVVSHGVKTKDLYATKDANVILVDKE